MTSPADASPSLASHLRDWFDDLRIAASLLTRVPMPHPEGAVPSGLTRSQRAFPLIGALIGLAVGLVYAALLALHVPVLAAAALALGASAALTGALHEDGLADVGDGFGGGRDRDSKLTIMRDSRLGTYGAVVLVVGFATKLAALAALPPALAIPGLMVAHGVGRAAIPALAAKMPFARADGLGKNAGRPTEANAIVAVVIGAILALLLLPLGTALLVLIVAAIAVAAVAFLAWRQIGGVTGDVFGAAEQAAEIAILVLIAARLA